MNGRHKQKNMERNSQDQFRKMTETPISGLILSLAAPTIASMMVTNLYNTADTWFVSRAGTSASGAVSVVFSLMAIYQAFGFMFGHGAGSNISRKLGEKREDLVKTYASTSLFLSLACGAAVSVLGLLFMNPLLRLLGSTETQPLRQWESSGRYRSSFRRLRLESDRAFSRCRHLISVPGNIAVWQRPFDLR